MLIEFLSSRDDGTNLAASHRCQRCGAALILSTLRDAPFRDRQHLKAIRQHLTFPRGNTYVALVACRVALVHFSAEFSVRWLNRGDSDFYDAHKVPDFVDPTDIPWIRGPVEVVQPSI